MTKEQTAEVGRAERQAALLAQAAKQPGVVELMELYEAWREMDQVADTARQAMQVSSIVTSADTSAPFYAQC